jgi:hypothetical protein
LNGLFSYHVIANGGQIVQLRGHADLEVQLYVDVFGTDRNRYEALVYRRDELRAVVRFTLRVVDPQRKTIMAEQTAGSASACYQEHFILTLGPLWYTTRLEAGPEELQWEEPGS